MLDVHANSCVATAVGRGWSPGERLAERRYSDFWEFHRRVVVPRLCAHKIGPANLALEV